MSTKLTARLALCTALGLLLSACETYDSDLRGVSGGFNTAQAAQNATATRPEPDARGIISYPTYQVAVAQRGDTVKEVAARAGVDAQDLAKFNGLPLDAPLRSGEVIALPRRVAATNVTAPSAPANVDVTSLAGQAIESAPATNATPAARPSETAEPIRHKVTRGETAFSVARLYKVPVRSLARWNGLGPQFSIREGQFLLIPTPGVASPRQTQVTTVPGQGTPTPTPPSAEKPLPKDTTPPAAQKPAEVPKPDLGPQTKPTATGRFAYPVQGSIIRDYAKGRNEGIDIKAAPGSAVKAADVGIVAAITESAEGVPIIVVRHADNLLTVYANVTDVQIKKGDQVRRGQSLAKLRDGNQSFVHFEVRRGFESVDPNSFLN